VNNLSYSWHKLIQFSELEIKFTCNLKHLRQREVPFYHPLFGHNKIFRGDPHVLKLDLLIERLWLNASHPSLIGCSCNFLLTHFKSEKCVDILHRFTAKRILCSLDPRPPFYIMKLLCVTHQGKFQFFHKI